MEEEVCPNCKQEKYNNQKVCDDCLDEIHYEAERNEPYDGNDFMNYCMSGDCW